MDLDLKDQINWGRMVNEGLTLLGPRPRNWGRMVNEPSWAGLEPEERIESAATRVSRGADRTESLGVLA
jgi:hypothetical protein